MGGYRSAKSRSAAHSGIPNALAILDAVISDGLARRPVSIELMQAWERPARLASCVDVHPHCSRLARTQAPKPMTLSIIPLPRAVQGDRLSVEARICGCPCNLMYLSQGFGDQLRRRSLPKDFGCDRRRAE